MENWKAPREILSAPSMLSNHEHSYKLQIDEYEIQLQMESIRSDELSKLLLLISADAKYLKQRSNEIIKKHENKIEELDGEIFQKSNYINQLELDATIQKQEMEVILEKLHKSEQRIMSVDSELNDKNFQLQKLTIEHDNFKVKSISDIQSLEKKHEDLMSTIESKGIEITRLSEDNISLSNLLIQRNKLLSAFKLHAINERIKTRLYYKALSKWRITNASSRAYHLSQSKAVKDIEESKAILLQQNHVNVQNLQQEHLLRLENDRRKYVRLSDSRDALVYKLLNNQQRCLINIMSQWKSIFIRQTQNKLLTSTGIIKSLSDELNSTHADAYQWKKSHGSALLISSLKRFNQRCMAAGFNKWVQFVNKIILVESLNRTHQCRIIDFEGKLSNLSTELEAIRYDNSLHSEESKLCIQDLQIKCGELNNELTNCKNDKSKVYEDFIQFKEEKISELKNAYHKISDLGDVIETQLSRIEQLEANIDKVTTEKNHISMSACHIQLSLQSTAKKNSKLQHDLDDVRNQLVIANNSISSFNSQIQIQCNSFDQTNASSDSVIKEKEEEIRNAVEQINLLNKELLTRETIILKMKNDTLNMRVADELSMSEDMAISMHHKVQTMIDVEAVYRILTDREKHRILFKSFSALKDHCKDEYIARLQRLCPNLWRISRLLENSFSKESSENDCESETTV